MLRRHRGRVKISGGFWLLAAWFGLANGWRLLGMVLSAAALHELGHYLVLRLFGAKIISLRLEVFGAVMETDSGGLSYGRELAAVLAGPAANFLCAFALASPQIPDWYAPAGAHLALGLFNLLPVRPLDGGRAVWLTLTWALGPAPGERAAGALGACAAAGLAAGLLGLMRETRGSLWLLPAVCGLFVAAAGELRRISPQKRGFLGKCQEGNYPTPKNWE